MKSQQIENILVKQGWKQKANPFAPSNTLHYYRTIAIKPECYFNKQGIQLHIQFYELDIDNNFNLWSIDFKAMIKSSEWCEFNFYSLEINNLKHRLEPLSALLISSWRSINAENS